jgi:galactonate dehydratase
MQELYRGGHRAFMVPLPANDGPRNSAFPRQVLNYLSKLRQAVGADSDWVLDCGNQLTAAESAGLARTLEPFHLLFLDEPIGSPTASALKKIGEEAVVPLGVGRYETNAARLQELLRAQAIDVPRPSYSTIDISSIRRLAAQAETHYMALAPLHQAGPISTAAALQVAAALPNFFIQEIPIPAYERDRQMRRELVTAAVESPKDGFLPLPTGPGLGITLNEDAVKKYQVR